MEWRKFSVSDYDIVKSWWEDWGWNPIPISSLSNDGFIVSKDGEDLYACWCYYTGTDIGLIEWVISNRKASKGKKGGALKYLIDLCVDIMKYNGVRAIFHMTNNESLLNTLDGCGFKRTDKNCTQTVKII